MLHMGSIRLFANRTITGSIEFRHPDDCHAELSFGVPTLHMRVNMPQMRRPTGVQSDSRLLAR